jgi:hypothetical protein
LDTWVRRTLLALLTLGTAAMIVELLLLGHYQDSNQMIPLAVGLAALFVIGAVAWSGGIVALRALQFTMLVYIGCGVVGATLHFVGDKDAPALAPGLMVQLGLLGLLFTYRHPASTTDPA